MSDQPSPPPLPVDDSSAALSEALRFRSMFFLTTFIGVAVLYLTIPSFSNGRRARPDVLTWVLIGIALADVPYSAFTFDPARMARAIIKGKLKKGRTPQLRGCAVATCSVASAYVSTPAAFGFLLVLISGEPWRALIFIPPSAAMGVILWDRVAQTFDELVASGAR